MSDDELRALRDRLGDLGMTPIVSSGLMMGPFESAPASAAFSTPRSFAMA